MITVGKLQAAAPAAAKADPVLLQDMIDRALAFIESQTRRAFGLPATVTEFLSGNGSRILRLPEPPAVPDSDGEIDLVEERAYPGAPAAIVPLEEIQVRLSGNNAYLARLGGPIWCQGFEYAVTYRHGYELDHGPKDIEQLLIDLIALRLAFRGKDGMRSETIGGYSYTRFGEGDLDSIDGAWATVRAWRRLVLV
jgi:hypothetical protein